MAPDTRTKGRQLSVSNIAWPADRDHEALELVAELGFDGVELAPGKVFGDLNTVSFDTVQSYRHLLESKGLSISALQSILFGVKSVHLFESAASRERMALHLRRVAELAGILGARACVFGSPTLRDPGTLSQDEAFRIAESFLLSIANDFARHGVELCFEANPALYKCRFVTRTIEVFELVERVNAPGIAMQLDTGTIFINGEDPDIIRKVERRIGHVHISEPNLAAIGTFGVDHSATASALSETHYQGWISIEMKTLEDWRKALQQAYALVRPLYCKAHNGT